MEGAGKRKIKVIIKTEPKEEVEESSSSESDDDDEFSVRNSRASKTGSERNSGQEGKQKGAEKSDMDNMDPRERRRLYDQRRRAKMTPEQRARDAEKGRKRRAEIRELLLSLEEKGIEITGEEQEKLDSAEKKRLYDQRRRAQATLEQRAKEAERKRKRRAEMRQLLNSSDDGNLTEKDKKKLEILERKQGQTKWARMTPEQRARDLERHRIRRWERMNLRNTDGDDEEEGKEADGQEEGAKTRKISNQNDNGRQLTEEEKKELEYLKRKRLDERKKRAQLTPVERAKEAERNKLFRSAMLAPDEFAKNEEKQRLLQSSLPDGVEWAVGVSLYREEVLQRERDRHRLLFLQETQEERESRLEKKRFRMMERRATMTEDEKRAHIMRKYLEKQARIASMTREERAEMLKKNAEYMRNYWKNLPPDRKEIQKKKMNEHMRNYYHKHGKHKKPQREKFLEYLRKKTAEETPEERQRRLRRYKVNAARRKLKAELEQNGILPAEEIEKRCNELVEKMNSEPLPPPTVVELSQYKPRPSGRKPKRRLPRHDDNDEDSGSGTNISTPAPQPPPTLFAINPLPSTSTSSTPISVNMCSSPRTYGRNRKLNQPRYEGDTSYTTPEPPIFTVNTVPSSSKPSTSKSVEVCSQSTIFKREATPAPPPETYSRPTSPCHSYHEDNVSVPDGNDNDDDYHDDIDNYANSPSPAETGREILPGDFPSAVIRPPSFERTSPHKTTDQSWICPHCSEILPTINDLNKHFESSHWTDSDEFKFVCMRCPWNPRDENNKSRFKTSKCLREHVQHHHASSYWPCPACNLLLYSKSRYDTHLSSCSSALRLDLNQSLIICDICGKSFTHQKWLTIHTSHEHHPDKARLVCPTCGRLCSHSRSFWNHFAKCGKFIPNISEDGNVDRIEDNPSSPTPRRDQQDEEGRKGSKNVKPNSYPCELCGKAFVQQCTLDDHIRRDHEGQSFICPDCGRNFQSAGKLWRHQAETHGQTDLPPPPGVEIMRCKYCQDFIMRGYEFHVKKKHPEQLDDFQATELPTVKLKLEMVRKLNPRKKYKNCSTTESGKGYRDFQREKIMCEHCPAMVNRENMKRHVARRHLDHILFSRYLKCPQCDSRLKDVASFTRHFAEEHVYQDIEKKLFSNNLIRRKFPHTKCDEERKRVVCQICKLELSLDKFTVRVHFVACHYETMDKVYTKSYFVRNRSVKCKPLVKLHSISI